MSVPAFRMSVSALRYDRAWPCALSRQLRARLAQAEAEVTVWSEVVPPFTLMPREALQAAGNTVLAGVMRTLLPLFLRRRAGPALTGTPDTQCCLHECKFALKGDAALLTSGCHPRTAAV